MSKPWFLDMAVGNKMTRMSKTIQNILGKKAPTQDEAEQGRE